MADGLLNKASIILTPTGYKAGTLYNVAPIDEPYEDFDFARASVASRVNSSGLVEMVGRTFSSELVTNGDFATDSDWSTTGTWDIINNQAEATANSTSQYIQQDFTITNGNVYKFTYEIIENTLNGNGAALSSSGGFGSVSLSNVVGTHTEYITASNDSATYALKIGVSGTATSGAIKIDNVSVKEVIDTNNIPRISYDSNGDNGHILLEPTSTNLFTYSENFNDSSWLENLGTVNLTSEVAPDGTTNSVFNYVGSNCNLFTQTQASGVEYTISFFVKSNNQSKDNFQLRLGSSGMRSEVFTATSEWVRYSYTNTPTSSIFSITSDGANDVDILIWGAQLEELPYATSYIPTLTGSTETRATETATGAGSADLINSTEGVLYAEIASLTSDVDSEARIVLAASGDTNNSLRLYYNTTQDTIEYKCRVSSSNVCDITYDLGDSTQFHKIACKWKQNDFALWVDGVEVGTDTSGSTFSADTLNVLNFSNATTLSDFFYGKVKALAVFNEALSDSELTQLTT